MDPKASAKSKRTQTQQARRNHPTPSYTAQKKKPGGDEKPRRAHHPALPTNWDRYGGDGDEAAEDGSSDAKRVDAEIAPKSKGADFAYLVEQARSQPGGERFSSPFDELADEFMQGVSSLISVRGKGLLSYCEDDGFIVEDDSSSTFEVPFLSMDLHALAAQLSKLKLSERLFIEADLLPEEAQIEESNKGDASEQSQTSRTRESELDLVPSALFRNVDSETELRGQHVVGSASNNLEILQEIKRPNNQSSRTQPQEIGLTKNPEPVKDSGTSKFVMHTVQSSKRNGTRFQAAAAEAELDLLLGSSGEATLSSSVAGGLMDDRSAAHDPMLGFFAPTVRLPGKIDSLGQVRTTTLDDDLDSLLGSSHAHLQSEVVQRVPHADLTKKNANIFKDPGRSGARKSFDRDQDVNRSVICSLDSSPAKAELDMLLDSLSVTGLSGSGGDSISQSAKVDPNYLTKGSPAPPPDTSFDKDLDDLLAETSL